LIESKLAVGDAFSCILLLPIPDLVYANEVAVLLELVQFVESSFETLLLCFE